jgi:hypothetical protein
LSVRPSRRLALAAAALSIGLAPRADALPPPAGVQVGRAARVAAPAAQSASASGCRVEAPVIGPLLSEVTGGACAAAGAAAGAVGGLVGEAASAASNGILGLVAQWMIGAATQITTFVASAMRDTTTPQLESSWFQAQFAPMADLGAALGLLVALLALGSAAVRRSPQALAATLAGIARAGIGTGLIVALTVIGLSIADQISKAVLAGSPHAFWASVAHAWGQGGFGGFGSSALAMLIALVEVFAAILVWLELIVRSAAIYLAVLFFPVALAAAIWPALGAWPKRLGRLLLLFVILKPVALIVLSFAGAAAAAGLSLGGGVPGSVGTILAATVIYALAAFAPWALMHLLAADAESAHTATGLRGAAAVAALDERGRSLRNAGGARNLFGPPGSGGSGRGPRGGEPDKGGRGGGAGPPRGGPSAGGGGAGPAEGSSEETLPLGGETIGAGGVGAAAGAGAAAVRASRNGEQEFGESSPGNEPGAGREAATGSASPAQGASGTSGSGGGRVISLPVGGRGSAAGDAERSASSEKAHAPAEERGSAEQTTSSLPPAGGGEGVQRGDLTPRPARSRRHPSSGSRALRALPSRRRPPRNEGSEE